MCMAFMDIARMHSLRARRDLLISAPEIVVLIVECPNSNVIDLKKDNSAVKFECHFTKIR